MPYGQWTHLYKDERGWQGAGGHPDQLLLPFDEEDMVALQRLGWEVEKGWHTEMRDAGYWYSVSVIEMMDWYLAGHFDGFGRR